MAGLDFGVIGNCSYGALIDREGTVVWCCLPRFDGDPVFHALLGAPGEAPEEGRMSIELIDIKSSEQHYQPNTAILVTRLHGESGSLEITDFAPRFRSRGRMFRPLTLVRRIKPIAGSPRIRISVTPRFGYGSIAPEVTRGSNHVRYVGPELTLRLTTNAPLDYLLERRDFNLEAPLDLIFGPDEPLSEGIRDLARQFEERTADYWLSWSQRLSVPLEWQDAVIRAAITLKLCTYEPTGAIIAAMTTSIPEAPDSGRNWDYRYCWLRDAFFVVRALNSLSAVTTMENYFGWLMNIVPRAQGGHLQPVYGIALEERLVERTVDSLPGYQGMGPVRVGNQAFEHFQHDVYGNVLLGAAQAFVDKRLIRRPGLAEFERLEAVGRQAIRVHDQPDAGMWELRTRARVHTSSSLMCWAACDRLAKIARRFGHTEKLEEWARAAEAIRQRILAESWNPRRGAFVESFGGGELDAGVLLMAEVGFIDPADERFIATVGLLEKTLGQGPHMLRYEAPDDFGRPETAFNVCAFWHLDALARIGRREQAREIFEALLEGRNHLGILSEDIEPGNNRLWGNYPQTYSMVGIINGARRLSDSWEVMV